MEKFACLVRRARRKKKLKNKGGCRWYRWEKNKIDLITISQKKIILASLPESSWYICMYVELKIIIAESRQISQFSCKSKNYTFTCSTTHCKYIQLEMGHSKNCM